MIRLTRLNGDEFVVNADLIRFVERRPDTYITLTTSERVIVRETLEEVVRRSLAWARAVRMTASVDAPFTGDSPAAAEPVSAPDRLPA